MIHIFNEDCMKTMQERITPNSVDVVLTSPPYNTSRPMAQTERALNNYEYRYDTYTDFKTPEEYCDWICEIFNNYDKILKKEVIRK